MKTLILVVSVFLLAGLCAAQTPAVATDTPPGVTVVESSLRGRFMRNPALEVDPLQALESQDRSERIRNEVIRQNEIRAAAGQELARVPARNATSWPAPPKSRYPYIYIYKVKIANTGNKKIQRLVWEYVLTDASTGNEAGRRQFSSKVNLKPGHSATLYGHSTLPPVSSVDANAAGQSVDGHYEEQVRIKTIYYNDKTTWDLMR